MKSDELVYSVHGKSATAAVPISLSQAGFHERQHLQEWVLAHPEILGDDVMVVTSEFDKWAGRDGTQSDRLDILALDRSGKLVVAELKRDKAPDFVTMQVIKYAAMASRFTVEKLADAYLDFASKRTDGPGTAEEALTLLQNFAPEVTDESLRRPRLSIIAGGFGPAVTSSVAWLSSEGIDITLTKVQAYQLGDAHMVTVSQVWPLPDEDDFIVAPTKVERSSSSAPTAPEVPWSHEDLQALAATAPLTILTTMDLCAAAPGTWVGGDQVMAATGREKNAHRGDYGGFAITLRRKFGRSNAPYDMNYAVGDAWQQYYRLSPDLAHEWRQFRPEADFVSADDHDHS